MDLSILQELVASIETALKTYQTTLEEKTTLEVVKEKNQLKKASDICEQILKITDKYCDSFEEKDLYKYNKLKNKFLKVN